MSTARPLICFFCSLTRSTRPPPKLRPRRTFHTTRPHLNRKPRFPNVKATPVSQIELHEGRKLDKTTRKEFKNRYSAEQMAAIEEANRTMDPTQFNENTLRTDPWSMRYYDDLSEVDPIVDKTIQQPWSSLDVTSRLKTTDEMDDDLANFFVKYPQNDLKAQQEAWNKFDREYRVTVGSEEHENRPRSARQLSFSDIPKFEVKTADDARRNRGGTDSSGQPELATELVRLMQMTGYTASQIASLRVKTVYMNYVTNQTRLGKIMKAYQVSIAGNGNGLVGIGEGKAEDPSAARLQSQYRAIRSMQPILRYENRTIYGDVDGKVGATELELYARPPGK